MELIRGYLPTEEAPRFVDLPMGEQVAQLRALAASKVAEQLDPIQQVQRELLNGIA
jgi:hypothetical protein